MAGTINFMSPEVFKNKPHNLPADMWSLGVLIYYICTGEMFYEERTLLKSVKLKKQPQIGKSFSPLL